MTDEKMKRLIEEARLKYTECPDCGGYGYTEAVSMSWTDDQLEEFSCKTCEGHGCIEK